MEDYSWKERGEHTPNTEYKNNVYECNKTNQKKESWPIIESGKRGSVEIITALEYILFHNTRRDLL